MINQFDKYKPSDVTAEAEQAEQLDELIETLATETNSPHRLSFDTIALERDVTALERKLSNPAAANVTDEKGPIEYFTRTKESLRHVTQPERVVVSPKYVDDQTNNDANEEDYVKVPVQQLINTFEKQMRSIIKQNINENIQIKVNKEKRASNAIETVNGYANGSASDTTTQNHRSSIHNGTMHADTNGEVFIKRKTSEIISTESSAMQCEIISNNHIVQSVPLAECTPTQSQWQPNTNQINVDSCQPNGTIDMNKANENQDDQSTGGKAFNLLLFSCLNLVFAAQAIFCVNDFVAVCQSLDEPLNVVLCEPRSDFQLVPAFFCLFRTRRNEQVFFLGRPNSAVHVCCCCCCSCCIDDSI